MESVKKLKKGRDYLLVKMILKNLLVRRVTVEHKVCLCANGRMLEIEQGK